MLDESEGVFEMRERVLHLTLSDAVEAFNAIHWKFFDVDEGLIRIEVPRGSGESFIVELPFSNERQRDDFIVELLAGGFIRQTLRLTSDW